MKVKLLGYKETKEHTPAHTKEWQDHDEGGTYYNLYFTGEDLSFMLTVSDEYGSCGSGYCGANWGSISKIKEISQKEMPNDLVKTTKDVFIELLPNNILNTSFGMPKEEWDAEIETLLSTDKEVIATSTGNGGCGYYPSGQATLNMDLFEKSK